jgi:Ca2+-binding RTX toxin-like protein
MEHVMIDSLEPRRLFSVTLSPKGTLAVVGTNDADSVQFAAEFKKLAGDTVAHDVVFVDLNGAQFEFDAAAVHQIDIATLSGPDLVILGHVKKTATIQGGKGDDSLSGGPANDFIFGGGGNDYLFGREGNDQLAGDVGYDNMLGGPGNDVLVPLSDLSGDDTIFGQEGRDVVTYASFTTPVTAVVGGVVPAVNTDDQIANDIEIIAGGQSDDRIINGSRHRLLMVGGQGNDTLQSSGGSDTLNGSTGNDSLIGVAGNDHFIAADGAADTIEGGTGSDILDSSDAGLDVVSGVP